MGMGRQGKQEKVIPDASIKNGIIQKNLVLRVPATAGIFYYLQEEKRNEKKNSGSFSEQYFFIYVLYSERNRERKADKRRKRNSEACGTETFLFRRKYQLDSSIEELGENFMSLYPNITLQMEVIFYGQIYRRIKCKKRSNRRISGHF